MTTSVEEEFEQAVQELNARSIRELGRRDVRFEQMLARHGGLETARRLLDDPKIHKGLVRLSMIGRVDLSVEWLVVERPWPGLFSDERIATAERRVGRRAAWQHKE